MCVFIYAYVHSLGRKQLELKLGTWANIDGMKRIQEIFRK